MNRREFLRSVGAGALAAVVPKRILAADRRRPNVVLFFIDDMGWKDTGYGGSDFYETPNIDRLATEGVVFTSAYAAAGNCAPSRACLISGQYTPRHGVYAVNSTKRGAVNRMRLVPIPNRTDLAPENVTVAEAMKAAGYATAMFGKWHLGKSGPTLPKSQGFDVDLSFNPPSGAQFKKTNDPKGIYKIAEAACRFMENNRDRPFLAYLSHHATHMAIQARKEMHEKFAAKKAGELHRHAGFAAMNAQMDDGVGVVLRKLKDLGLEKDTLVIFTSDNGGLPQSSQAPLRGFKGVYYEGGIRVPMIARWPGVVEPGSKCDVPVHNVDLYPTCLAAAGAAAPAGKQLDGESLLPLLKGGRRLKREAIFWHFPGYLDRANSGSRDRQFRTRPVSVIRKGDWKLHLFHEEWALDGGREKIDTNNAVELYDLAGDVGERKDLAARQTDKRNELLDDLLAWLKKSDAPLPTQANPSYDPTAPADTKKRGGRRKRKKQKPPK